MADSKGKRRASSPWPSDELEALRLKKRPRRNTSSHSASATNAKAATTSLDADDATSDSPRKSEGGHASSSIRFDLSRLPPEVIQLILEHWLTTLDAGPKQIHFKKNHEAYNAKLAQIVVVASVSKLFRAFLLPHLYHTIRLPRRFGYAHTASFVEDQVHPRFHRADDDAELLATQLQDNIELRHLVKTIHVDPVVRVPARHARRDALNYARLIQSCHDTVENLAIAVNACEGVIPQSRTHRYINVLGKHFVLEKVKDCPFPALKHLTLEFMQPKHLDWVQWQLMPNLTSVTFIAEHLFTADILANSLDATQTKTNLYHALSKLPRTVESVTFGFHGVHGFSSTRTGSWARHSQEVHWFVAHLLGTFKLLSIARREDGNPLSWLKNIRLVWAWSPEEWCEKCLGTHRDRRHALPALQRMRAIEQRYDEIATRKDEPLVHIEPWPASGSTTSAFTSSSASRASSQSARGQTEARPTIPTLEMYQITIPPAWEPRDEDESPMCSLEVLWKALLYNEAGSEVEQQQESAMHSSPPTREISLHPGSSALAPTEAGSGPHSHHIVHIS
ncbi:hypothetical protein V8E36_000278 [Tilletia maclaganii]